MGRSVQKPQETLYERDFYGWLQEQAGKLRARSGNELDWDNLAEELESVGRIERKEIETRLAQLILHLLKWQFQPGRRSESWRVSISEQRIWIPGIIENSPSLKPYPARVFRRAYDTGRRWAVRETGLSSTAIPSDPPFTAAQALDGGFWPGETSEPHSIIRD